MKHILEQLAASIGIYLLASSVSGSEKLQRLAGGLSPQSHFGVQAAELDGVPMANSMVYQVINLKTHRVLLNISSTHSPAASEEREFFWDYVVSASACWNKDESLLLINEASHHGGTVFLVQLDATRQNARLLTLPRKELIESTKDDWIKVRLAMDEHPEKVWLSARKLRLLIPGDARIGSADPLTGKISHEGSAKCYEAILWVSEDGGVRIGTLRLMH